MGERYHRSQLLLEPEQHDRMRHIANREGRSISDVAREAIRIGLDALAEDREVQANRRALALRKLEEIREAALIRHGIYEGSLVAEAREERERDLESVQRGSA